jgi:hypothetical protein
VHTSSDLHLQLHRQRTADLVREAQSDARAVRLVRLRRRERAAERAVARVRLARLALA